MESIVEENNEEEECMQSDEEEKAVERYDDNSIACDSELNSSLQEVTESFQEMKVTVSSQQLDLFRRFIAMARLNVSQFQLDNELTKVIYQTNIESNR